MTVIEIFTLILIVFFVAVGVGYNYSKHKGSLKDMIQDVKDIEVQAEQVANELYNKDLRPIVAKKAPKKEKVVDIETLVAKATGTDEISTATNQVPSQDITQEVVEKIVQVAKITPEEATIEVQPVIEKVKETKPEFPIDKPKRKRKYYPKKK